MRVAFILRGKTCQLPILFGEALMVAHLAKYFQIHQVRRLSQEIHIIHNWILQGRASSSWSLEHPRCIRRLRCWSTKSTTGRSDRKTSSYEPDILRGLKIRYNFHAGKVIQNPPRWYYQRFTGNVVGSNWTPTWSCHKPNNITPRTPKG